MPYRKFPIYKPPAYLWKASGVVVITLTGAYTIDLDSVPPLLVLDPGGAGRNVTLPAEEGNVGLYVSIRNAADAAETITVKNDATTTITTIAQNEWKAFFCNGTDWIWIQGP